MFSHPLKNRVLFLLAAVCLFSLAAADLLAQDSRQLLDKAATQIDAGEYIAAKQTLDQVKPAQLTPADKGRLTYLRAKADNALGKVSNVRKAIEDAKTLARNNNFVAARQKLDQALKTPNLDPAAKRSIKTTIVEIDTRRKQVAVDMKKLFSKSVADYEAGRLDQAEKGFKTVDESGVDLGFWDRGKPKKYLKKIADENPLLPTPNTNGNTDTVSIRLSPSGQTSSSYVNDLPGGGGSAVVIAKADNTSLKPIRPRSPSYVSFDTSGQTLIDRELRRRKIIAGQIAFRHKVAMESAENFLIQNKFAEALRVVREAQDVLITNQSILQADAMALMHTTGRLKLAHIETQQRLYQSQQAEQRQYDAEIAVQQALSRAGEQRQTRVDNLVSEASTYFHDRQYQLALDRYIQVLNIDPNNRGARNMVQWLEDEIWLLEHQDLDKITKEAHTQVMRQTIKASIPYDPESYVVWPDNWEKLSRDRLGAGIAQDTPENMNTRRLLGSRHPSFDYEETPLSEVFDDLADKSGLNIVPNWQSLSNAGIEQDQAISIQLHNVTFERVLKAILANLSSASGGYFSARVSYNVEDGVVVIATSEDLGAELSIETYDIAHLLIQSADNRGGPSYEAGGGNRNQNQNQNRSGTGQTSTIGWGTSQDEDFADVAQLREDMLTGIQDMIRSIDPDSWTENGGRGTVSIWTTQLVIFQTADVHAKIRRLLDQIRNIRPIQIAVEARFIYVTDSFLEDIGLDLDFTFHNNSGNWTDIRIPQGSSAFVNPGDSGIPGAIGASATALTISGAFLDDLQVDFFLRATQASRKATTLTAPRATFENASSAYIFVGRATSYVQDIDSNVENCAVGYDITIGTIHSGPTLNIAGVVSPDRRFVRLDVEVTLDQLIEIPFLADLLPNSFEFGFGQFFSFGALGLQQLPIVDRTVITTQVSIPDGGALLIGGLRQRKEETKSAGVPILNKIPWLKRFFSNTSYIDDKSTLVILLRPKIIDLMEQQGQKFPRLGER